MQNANILVTGCSSGFGKLIALTLADSGHRVFAGMRGVGNRNASVAAELVAHSASHPITPIELDVNLAESITTAVAEVLDKAGQIDVLVNCAGVMWLGTTEAYSVAQVEGIMQTNFIGPFQLMKAVLPGMRARRDGLLVTITSTAGRSVIPAFGIYGASKQALEVLTEAIGYEVAGLGIDSVIVEPGPFPSTNLRASQQAPADQNIVVEYGEYGRFPEQIQAGARAAGETYAELMDPRLVADSVRDLVAAAKGSRPVRMTVGLDFGLQEINQRVVQFQAGILSALGVAEVQRTKPDH